MPSIQQNPRTNRYTGQASPVFIAAVLIIVVLAAAAIVLMIRAMILPPTEIPPLDTITPSPTTTEPPVTTAPPSTFEPIETTVPPDDTTAPPDTNEPYVPKPITLPESADVGEDYFKSLLFIGDSRTQGLQIATGGYGAAFYANRGLSVDGMGKTQFITVTNPDGSSKTLTVLDALRAEPFAQNIYVWLGLNAVGWNSTDRFRNLFRTDLEALIQACPQANIVIMSILPVGRNAVVIGCDDNVEVNRRVVAYNQILLDLAEHYDLYFLNCYEAFVDAEGFLPPGYSNDDMHLRKEQNLRLCEYIRTHSIP